MQIPDSQAVPMSQRAYAKRRKVSHVAVQNAIKGGRLVASVRNGKIVDPELADREWDANTDHSRAPSDVRDRAAQRREAPREALAPADAAPTPEQHPKRASSGPGAGAARPAASAPPAAIPPPQGPPTTLAEANMVAAYWKGKQAELDYREEAGQLVPAAKVAAAFRDRCARVRTKLLGLPSRARQVLPEMSLGAVEELERLVRESLEELSEEPPK